MGVSEKLAVPYLGVLIIRITLFRVLYCGPLFSETPISVFAGCWLCSVRLCLSLHESYKNRDPLGW